MNALHTMFANGAVRDTSGKLIAFYDRDSGELDIDHVPKMRAIDEAHAMDLIAQHYKPQ